MVRSALDKLIARLRQETFDETESSETSWDLRIRDMGYKAGHNDRTRSLVRELEALRGDVVNADA